MKNYQKIIYMLLLVSVTGCGKKYLDIKPDQTQKVPENIADYQALMDNTNVMNLFSCHGLGMIGSDEYYMLDARYNVFPAGTSYNYMKRGYTWSSQIFEGGEINTDWSRGYTRVLQTNVVLDGLKKISPTSTQQDAWNNVKGSALFYRALAFYSMAQLFCKPYNAVSSSTDMGLPLRLEPDVTVKTDRSTVAQTYQQVLNDLYEAIALLPNVPKVFFRPSKAAVFALLSRTYLQMGDYNQAATYATQCLAIKNTLIDYNSIALSARYTFPSTGTGNQEVIFYTAVANLTPLITSNINVDKDLIASYSANDLRKQAFLYNNTDGRILFKGSYSGASDFFTGFTTGEILLNRAECYARAGKISEALSDLNQLSTNRYNKSSFVPFTSTSSDDVLGLIIIERRKEMIFRGTRWEDLRRLNKETRFAKTLTRTVNGTLYQLSPNDQKYVWPLLLEAISTGGYQQNPR